MRGKRSGAAVNLRLQLPSATHSPHAPKRLRTSSPSSPPSPSTPASPAEAPAAAPPSPPTPNATSVERSFSRSGSLDGPLRAKALSECQEPSTLSTSPSIGHYSLLSQLDSHGKAFHARHASGRLATAHLLSDKQRLHLLKVRQRLNAKGDGREEALLPAASDLVQEKGQSYLFSPRGHGSLHSYVQARKKLSEPEARRLYQQIVDIVAFAHSIGIVVRDLKLRQFVFVDPEQTQLRMSSVSEVVVLEGDDDRLSDRHGCPAYVSPEILSLTQASHSGKAADMWSLGVLLFVMLLGRYPFYDQTPSGLFGKIREGQFWIPREEGLSLECRLLLRGLLRREPEERPTARRLAALPWLRRTATSQSQDQSVPQL